MDTHGFRAVLSFKHAILSLITSLRLYHGSIEKEFPLLRSTFILLLALGAVWLTLSGYFTGMLLTLGAISLLLVWFMCWRMKILDVETAPYGSVPQTLSYFAWLFSEIVKANVAVVKAVMSPNMEISPIMTQIPLSADADISKVMFANSITLTPGTVSLAMNDDHILVHALLEEMSNPADFTEMAERSAWAVGESL